MNSKSIIRNFLSNNPIKIFSVVAFSLLAITFKILVPVCMKVVLDYSLLSNNTNDFGQFVILFSIILGVSLLLSLIFDAARQFKIVQFGNSVTSELRSKAFQTILKSEFYELNKLSNEELSKSIVNDTDLIGNKYISSKLIKIFYHMLYLSALVITLCVFDVSLGLIALVSLPMFYFIYKYLGKYQTKIQNLYSSSKNEHQYIIDDRFKQLKTIKTRNGVEEENESYEKVLVKYKKLYAKSINVDKFKNILVPAVFVSFLLLVVIIDTTVNFYEAEYTEYLRSIGSVLGSTLIIPTIYLEFKKVLDTYYTEINFEEAASKLDSIYVIKGESRSENVPSLEEIHTLKFNSISFDFAPTYSVS